MVMKILCQRKRDPGSQVSPMDASNKKIAGFGPAMNYNNLLTSEDCGL